MALFASNMITYVEYTMKSTKDLKGLISCRIQYKYAKLNVFPYTS